MEMSYKQASKIRQTGLLDSISKKLISGESIGSSVKSTIKESTKARAVGVKEKFDPMNIAKMMTGGSNIGPALIGRMLGRSTEDLDYFTNLKQKNDKLKGENLAPVSGVMSIPEMATEESQPTATKIKPEKGDEVNYNEKAYRWMGAQWGEVSPKTGKTGRVAKRDVSPILFQLWSDGGYMNVPEPPKEVPQQKPKQTRVSNKSKANKEELSEALSKIYNLLQNSSEDRKKSADLEKDLDEERKTEDERRHKELIEALLKIGGGSKREKEKTSSLLSSLLGMLAGLFSFISPEVAGKGGEGDGKGNKGGEGDGKGNKGGEGRGGEGDGKGGEGKGGGSRGSAGNKSSSASRIEGKPLTDFGEVGEKIQEQRNAREGKATKIQDTKGKAVKGSKWMQGFLDEVTKANNAKLPEGAGNVATKIAQSKAYNVIVKSLSWLNRIPGINAIAAGYQLNLELNELKEMADKGELTEEQLKEGTKRAWYGAFGGAAGAQLGAMVGAYLGVGPSAALASTGAGALAAPFVELGFTFGGGVLGYMGGDKLGRLIFDQFVAGGEPLIEATPGMLEMQKGIIENKPDRGGFSFEPSSSLQMESPSGELSKIAVALTNENRDLNLSENVAMLEPIILENNVNNMKGGKNQTRITSPDGSIRTTNPSINWSLKSNVRTV